MSEILELRLPSCAVSWWAFVLSTPRPRGQMINCSCPVSGLIKHLQELLKPQTVLGEVSPIEAPSETILVHILELELDVKIRILSLQMTVENEIDIRVGTRSNVT